LWKISSGSLGCGRLVVAHLVVED